MGDSYWSIDVPGLLQQFRGRREQLNQIIDAYLEQYPQLLAEVGRAAAARDAAALARSARGLKAALRVFHVRPPIDSIGDLERAATGGHLSDVDDLYARLEAEMGRLGGELRRVRQTAG